MRIQCFKAYAQVFKHGSAAETGPALSHMYLSRCKIIRYKLSTGSDAGR